MRLFLIKIFKGATRNRTTFIIVLVIFIVLILVVLSFVIFVIVFIVVVLIQISQFLVVPVSLGAFVLLVLVDDCNWKGCSLLNGMRKLTLLVLVVVVVLLVVIVILVFVIIDFFPVDVETVERLSIKRGGSARARERLLTLRLGKSWNILSL